MTQEYEDRLLSKEDLLEIQLRCDRSRPGPWRSFVEGRDHTAGSNFIMIGEGTQRSDDIELLGATIEEQDFIAHARDDVPRLLAEIAELRKRLGIY